MIRTPLTADETEEYNRLKHNLGALRCGAKFRTSKKLAKRLLQEGWFTWNGRFLDPRVKHVGLGVYEVSVVLYEP